VARGLADRCVREFVERRELSTFFENSAYVSLKYAFPTDSTIKHISVHELAHGAWEHLGGDDLYNPNIRGIEALEIMKEGYASYWQKIMFFQDYPRDVQDFLRTDLANPPDNLYTDGRNRIQALVEKHGPEILMQIPTQWRKYW